MKIKIHVNRKYSNKPIFRPIIRLPSFTILELSYFFLMSYKRYHQITHNISNNGKQYDKFFCINLVLSSTETHNIIVYSVFCSVIKRYNYDTQ